MTPPSMTKVDFLGQILQYKKEWTKKDDKLPDFSYADHPAAYTLRARSGDQTRYIQSALDHISQSGGGVLALETGTYLLITSLMIANGTTLRGAGVGKIILTRKGLESDFLKLGSTIRKQKRHTSVKLTDGYVPTGTNTVRVSDANGLAVGMHLMPYEPPVFASEIGIENLSMIIKPKCSGIPLSDTRCRGFNNHIDIEKFASRTTVTCVVMNRDGVTDRGAGYALDIDIGGSQVLIHNCTTRGAKNAKSYGVATKTLAAGPNACIGYTAMDPIESIQPHQRWAHGFLNEGSNGRGIAVQESW
ncbi:hypothetical protein COCC4DRAFT_206230 [Bipolaris maydis ATCC 48331]|uniref:Pectate lyase superfamily protein domain-containing protein n=2 Tax=Cochliobolus heterostrophus TaxID=5016 RepID=M2UHJ6_COCH5|nr:uncharacterized protein COCC4DRAFT_206230 [Bipolaris maydis ATCC 48331]EMD93166.1 hypothetical protein COCHEDRAFT_1193465 [Bipolaris maydis C5]KAJ5025797.1 hypothetical protein J3E73DRAFT_232867 [Bipolaris maydis]ENI00241.1 hypothetical protein COCC4DRAFT_206230 [Bipolaris maydis ATCC 48331]KAJ6208009.1 hypothetical protein PSV09DRAFT_1193465 [Bipolaris maydis]KAJ6270008.1 hypothetical protein PSV08DRAFT_224064 [Bipolaris maydis]